MPAPPSRLRRLARAVAFAVVLGLPVAALTFLVRAQASAVVVFDQDAVAAATDYTRDHPALHSAAIVWQEAFQARWVNLAVTAVCVWAWRRHGLGTRALRAFTTLMVAWGLGNAVKLLVARARPVVEDALNHAPGYSFPSGHATNTTAAGIILVLLLWPILGRTGRVALTAGVAFAVVVTALDRVLLGAHYPSDVVAGVALGAAMAGASYLGNLGWHPSNVKDTE